MRELGIKLAHLGKYWGANAENPEPFDPGFLSSGSSMLGKRTERVSSGDGGTTTGKLNTGRQCLVGDGVPHGCLAGKG
jgi:hypothetical protein